MWRREVQMDAVNKFLFEIDDTLSQEVMIDTWITFLTSFKGKNGDQIKAMLNLPDMYLGISTTSYEGTIKHPKTQKKCGTYSIVLESGLLRHISFTSPIGLTHA